MSASAPRVILFDFDGTLVDSTPVVKQGLAEACAQLNRPLPDSEQLDQAITRGLRMDEIARLLDPAATPQTIETWITAYRTAYARHGAGHSPLFDGAREVLAGLRERGYALAILSNKSEPAIHAALRHFNIDAWFEHVWGEQPDLPGKPHPDIFQQRIQPAYPDCPVTAFRMVGDTVADHDFAHHCGIPFYLAAYGYGTRGLSLSEQARPIHHLAELLDHLPPRH